MPVFTYEALDSQGQEVKAEIEAESNDDAITKIRQMGYFPTNVRVKKGKGGGGGGGGGGAAAPKKKGPGIVIGGVKQKDLTIMTRQLATLVDAGLPIVRSLKILESQQKPGLLKFAVGSVAEEVEGGSTLSEAMAKFPKVFDKLYVNMVKAGEAGGVLDTILERLAVFREKSMKLKKQVVAAMIYPAAVITVMVAILSVIMIKIVPQFQAMFEEMGLDLPALTQMLIFVSSTLAAYWYLLPGVPFAAYTIFKLVSVSKPGRWLMDKASLKVPIFGTIVSKSTLSRFCRTLGTLIASGVPILDALAIVRDATANVVIAGAIQKVHESIREGENIAGPLAQSKVVDVMVVNMIDVGEETGELDKMLIKIADTFDDDVDTLVTGMMSLIEPMLIVVMGLSVGFIVISLFLPLISLMEKMGS
ncbi:MAG: type II secretion system F family protein [Planctomycetota bacterium]|nr:type II secretion system F family protein [Planctomycetota bacterium]